jgi:hypothetical protein
LMHCNSSLIETMAVLKLVLVIVFVSM